MSAGIRIFFLDSVRKKACVLSVFYDSLCRVRETVTWTQSPVIVYVIKDNNNGLTHIIPTKPTHADS